MTYRLGQYVNNKDPVDQHLNLHLYTPLILICRLVNLSTCRLVDLSTCRPVDLLMWTLQKIHLPSQFLYFRLDYTYLSISIFWQYRFVDLSTCRPVDLSTCRPSAIVNNKHLYMSFICTAKIELSTCRPVDLSTCRPSAIVNNKDPVRVRVRVSVWLGLGLG